MAPRKYNLGRRAETASATRDRIVDAAAAVYRERGVTGATIDAIAKGADVARGTVLNHFGGADGVLDAVLDRAAEEVRYPTEVDLEGAETPEARIRRFVDVTFRFFERSSDWWSVFAADREHPLISARERTYWEVAARFQAAAFGELAGDRIVGAAVRAFVDYGPLYAARAAGLSLEESIALVGDTLVDVARRRAGKRGLR
jgi:AcrR family transcriptional regulator